MITFKDLIKKIGTTHKDNIKMGDKSIVKSLGAVVNLSDYKIINKSDRIELKYTGTDLNFTGSKEKSEFAKVADRLIASNIKLSVVERSDSKYDIIAKRI